MAVVSRQIWPPQRWFYVTPRVTPGLKIELG